MFSSIFTYVSSVLDVLLLAFLIYNAYELLAKSHAVHLIWSALWLIAIYAIARLLHLRTTSAILSQIMPGLVIGLVLIFQPEIRTIFSNVISSGNFHKKQFDLSYVDEVLTALATLSEMRRGALIVFQEDAPLTNVIESGVPIHSEITASLIVTIFGYNTPLHDGAIVIKDSEIVAGSCLLPLTNRIDITRHFGTRHRSALGLTEHSDALVMVVSEESGAISLVYRGVIQYDLSTLEAKENIMRVFAVRQRRDKVGGT